MEAFLVHYGACLVLSGLGLLLVIVSYAAARAGRSGIPLVGGLLIAAGFLTTPYKWLALLCLIDYGFWMIPYARIYTHIYQKKFDACMTAQDYQPHLIDRSKRLMIRIPARNETLERSYDTNTVFQLNVPRLMLALCRDASGAEVLLLHPRRRGAAISACPLTDGKAVLTAYTDDGAPMTVRICIEDLDAR